MSTTDHTPGQGVPASGGVLVRFDFIGRELDVKPLRIKPGNDGTVTTRRLCARVAQYATDFVTMRGCRVVVDGSSLVIAGGSAEVGRGTVEPLLPST